MPHAHPRKPLFLAGQQLSLLTQPKIPEPETLKRVVCDGARPESGPGQGSDEYKWSPYVRDTAAEHAAGRDPWKRVALLCDAGLGKTTNMHWLAAQFAKVSGSPQIPLFLRMDNAKDLHALRMAFNHDDDAHKKSLLHHLAVEVNRAKGGSLESYKQALRRHRAAGRITLIIDGLDHVSAEPGFRENLQGLIASDHWRNCPVWLSGRPYALRDCWKQLFAGTPWQFLRVEPLPETEVRRAMRHATGGDWYEQFPTETRWMLATPRLLRLICGIIRLAIAKGNLDGLAAEQALQPLDLRTPADVYYKAYFEKGDFEDRETQGLLVQGLIGEAAKLGSSGSELRESNYEDRRDRMGTLLGAIAFEMQAMNSNTDRPEPNTSGVAMKPLKTAVARRLIEAGQGTEDDFERDLDLLRKMNNSTLDYLILSDTSDKAWIFHDRTVQAFFAASWATKFASLSDRELMLKNWIIDKKVGERLSGFAEFWQFAAEMPDAALIRENKVDHVHWVKVFEPCYEPPELLKKTPPECLQWTRQMICHTYERMARRSEGTIKKWRRRWLDLEEGRGDPEQLKIYRTIRDGFRRCPKDKAEDGKPFRMGSPVTEEDRSPDEVQRLIHVAPFALHEFQMTNAQYELYALEHEHGRDEVSSGADQPVTSVTFWDAWVCACWMKCRLPTEEEWEYACRAGMDSPFSFGSELNGTQANCNGYYPYGTMEKGPYLGRTVPLDKEHQEYKPNGWGLWHMHGNVWEWCDLPNVPGDSARLRRGGCWDSSARSCRSAFRDKYVPEYRYDDGGLRLAAAPCDIGPKQDKPSQEKRTT